MPSQILVEIAAEHLAYEIDMLRVSYYKQTQLGTIDPATETPEQKVCRFALIESFCVHARALLDFFANKRTDSTDSIASDFTTAAYTPPFDLNTQPIKDPRTRLNKQLLGRPLERRGQLTIQ